MEENQTKEIIPTSSYDTLVDYIDNKMLFEGKSINEWIKYLSLPAVPDHIDWLQMIKLNQRAIFLSEIVFNNLSLAKARLIGAKAAYNKKLNLQKELIRDSYDKKPPNDVIENKAINKSANEATALTIAEFFFGFWTNQVEKINAFNTRLTSLNITVNQENKILNSSTF